MAVLHIVQYSLPQIMAGYTVRTQAIVREQQGLGLDPVVLTSPRHPSEAEEEVEGIPHYRCRQEQPGRSRWLRDAARVRNLAARVEELAAARGDVRLLHAHSPVLCGLAALRASRRLGLPIVYEVRGLWEEGIRGPGSSLARWARRLGARAMETRVCRRAGAVVAISEGLRQEFLRRGAPAARVYVITNGVDLRRFSPRAPSRGWRTGHGLTEGPLILYLGALREYEGVRLLVEAFAEIGEHHPAAQLLVIGEGEARAGIEAQARARGGPIHVLPAVPHEETPDCYAAADLLVYPRLSNRATERVTPLKPLEAMAMGKAIVASDVGGLRELLADGETARLFPAGSVTALAQACCDLLGDEQARARLGGRAREVALARYDWRAIVPGYLAVYQAAGLR